MLPRTPIITGTCWSGPSIKKPKTGELLFIPQKPYMLLGSLREQLCYPTAVDKFSDDHLISVLKEVNLNSLIQRYPNLDIKQDWPRILSLGEQQRLAFARLLLNSPRFAILDEAQNVTPMQMKMFLTRLGVTSKAIITGDVTQIDLPNNNQSGLIDAVRLLKKIDGIAFVEFNENDVVRHRLVKNIIKAYAKIDNKRSKS